jgi:AcrR family transcriptional regulator
MSSDLIDTRERILEAALNLLEQGGALRMTDIAREARISRQALYLHFASRADLLVEATRHLDRKTRSDEKLAPSRSATTGTERLDAFVIAWTSYLPVIANSARTLLYLGETDPEARDAWAKRMQDMREGCEAAVLALARDGDLANTLTPEQATDMLWTLLSYRNWAHLRNECGWSDKECQAGILMMARRVLQGRD